MSLIIYIRKIIFIYVYTYIEIVVYMVTYIIYYVKKTILLKNTKCSCISMNDSIYINIIKYIDIMHHHNIWYNKTSCDLNSCEITS